MAERERRPTAIPCFSTCPPLPLLIPLLRFPLLTLSLLAHPVDPSFPCLSGSLLPCSCFHCFPFLPRAWYRDGGQVRWSIREASIHQPVISSAMRGCLACPFFLPSSAIPFFPFELDSCIRIERERVERDPVPPLFSDASRPMLAFLYSPPLLRPLLAEGTRWWIKWSLLQFANEGAEGDARVLESLGRREEIPRLI